MKEVTPECELNDRDRELVERLAEWVVKKRLTTPAILFLESIRPLNYVGSQVMVFFQPAVQTVFKVPEWDRIRLILERRESIGLLVDMIESKEAEAMLIEKERKAKLKEQRPKRRWFSRKKI